MRILFLFLILNCSTTLFSQVEIYRGEEEDTSTFIAPGDTITSPPMFGNGVGDFLHYLEMNINIRNVENSLNYQPDVFTIQFIIDKKGRISDYETIAFTDANVAHHLELAILRMPEWKPGYQDGRKKKTTMVYKLNIRKVTDVQPIEVTLNDSNLTYSNELKGLRLFLAAGGVLVLLTLWIIK